MFRNVTPGTASRLTMVDHDETYGRHILETALRNMNVSHCVDLGCGNGDDLLLVKERHAQASCIGIDFNNRNRDLLTERGIESVSVNIESQPLPIGDASMDLVIANQILEHVKEIYWINHEIFRVLKVGGCLYLGVPNVLSLHNRILGFFGVHPTSAKLISAHVRVFSKRDTISFYRNVAGDVLTVDQFHGSQFYPFPRVAARALSALFPSLAFSIFFLIRKTREYNGEFLAWPGRNHLETNYYRGRDVC
jgi:ubiquinone/menaquinone biosynthesis C-methylase UbiE